MQTVFFLLVSLIGMTPALFFVGGPMIQGLLLAYVAVAVAVVGLWIRPGEAEHLSRILRAVVILAIIPAVWMAIQILPIPDNYFVHPIWKSAQAATHESIIGSISLDRGATLIAITRYCFFLGVVFVAAAVSIDRMRAEFLLLEFSALTAFAAIIVIGLNFSHSGVFREFIGQEGRTSLVAFSGLGIIVNAAAVIRAAERYETRGSKPDASLSRFTRMIALSLGALAISWFAVISSTSAQIVFAATGGFAAFSIIMVIRRLGLRSWENVTIGVAAAIAMTIVAFNHSGTGDLTLRFTNKLPASQISMSAAVLSDANLFGNGAGTFATVLPVYRDVGETAAGPYAPTTAANIAIELGRPALWAILVMTVILLVPLLRGALQRGRDSFYPSAGVGCAVFLTIEAFCDSSLLSTTVLVVVAPILGLALAQCASRTDQLR